MKQLAAILTHRVFRLILNSLTGRAMAVAVGMLMLAASTTALAQGTAAPRVGSWGHNVAKCTNYSHPSQTAADCRILDGGTWDASFYPPRCTNQAHPRPWLNESLIEPKVSERSGGQSTTFTGWLSPGQQTSCTGAWSGGVGMTFNIESSNLGLVEVGDATVTDYMARRDRTVACPHGYGWNGTTCVLPQSELTLHKNNDFCPAFPNGSNPVHSNTGKKLQRERDVVGIGPFPLRFTRYYSSGQRSYFGHTHIRFGNLGTNWRHSYSREVIVVGHTGSRTATVVRPNGNEYFFNEDAQGDWIGDSDVAERLDAILDSGDIVGWRYHTTADEIEEYDDNGRLVLITNRVGFTQTLSHDLTTAEGGDDAPDTLDRVTGPFGERSLQFTYGGDGQITQITSMPGGEVYRYEYDSRLLTAAVYPDGNDDPAVPTSYDDNPSRQYAYDESAYITGNPAPASLTGIVDESGTRYASWWYSGDQVTRSQHAPNDLTDVDRVDFQYNTDGTRTITDALGAVRVYGFNIIHGVAKISSISGGHCEVCGSSLQSVTYDVNGYKDVVTDHNGHVTDYDHDALGLEVQRVEAMGTSAERAIQTDWHTDFRVPTERRTLDSGGTLVSKTVMAYNARGQVLTTTQTDPATGANRTTTAAYCEQADVDVPGSTCPHVGLLKSVDGARTDLSDVTVYAYYPDTDHTGCETGGACHHRGDLWKITNALGHTTEFTRYDRTGRVLQVKDANGLISDFEYHARGWLTARKIRGTNPGVESDDRITRIEYWPAGLVKKVTQPNGAFLTFTYDAAQRLTTVHDNDGNAIEYGLDKAGNRTQEDVRDASGTLRRALSRTYNQLGELQALIDGEANSTAFTYDADGNVDTNTDPLGAVTGHDYDPLERLSKTLQDVGGIDAESTYAYDVRDNLTSVSAANGTVTTYEYDGLDNLEKEISPDRGTTIYTYDAAGNQKTKLDARGKLTSYTYDALNRLTLITLDGGGTIAYEYDVGSNAIGRLTKITDASGQTTWSYDHFGAVSQKAQIVGSVTLVTDYGYDADGRLTSMTLPSGKVVGYGYTGHRQTSVSVDSTVILTGATYEPFGPVNGWTWGFGAPTSRDYDLRGLASTVDLGGEYASVGRDAAGQVTSATFPLSGFDLAFDYDLLGRLTAFASHPPAAPLPAPDSQLFEYDENGNRASLTEDGTPYAYTNVASSNRLSDTSGPVAKSFSYDAAGNVIGDGVHSYGYDDRGRLVSVDSGAATYAHDGQGQRVKKDVGGTVTLFAYDEAGRLTGEYDGQGNALMEHVWFDDRPVAALKGSVVYSVDTDHLGAPRVISEGFGIVWTWISDPFGSTPAQEYTDGAGVLFKYHLRFPGQYYDEETGLHYNYFRTYDPSTGRYLESDPIGLQGGLNTYGYVSANPLSNVDPLGLAEWDVVGSGSLGAVAGIGAKGEWYILESECDATGKKYRISVLATGPSAGAALKCNYCWTAPGNVGLVGGGGKFEDHSPNPNPNAFNGPYLSVKVGFKLFGFGGDYGDTVLGTATSLRQYTPTASFGTVEAEVAGTIGTSTVQDVETISCGCEGE